MYKSSILPNWIKPRKKVPVRLQMNQYDCGPICLQMMLAYYGYEANFTKMKELFTTLGTGRDGSSMLKIKEVAEIYNLKSMAKKADYKAFDNQYLPVILFWEKKHFVILESIKNNNQYTIVDPAMGRQVVTEREFARKYSGIFLVLHPDKNFKPQKENDYNKLNFFKNLVLSNKKHFMWAVLLALLLQLIAVAVPFLMQISVDQMLQSQDYSLYTILISGMLMLVIFQLSFNYIKDICLVKLQELLDSQLTNGFVSHLLLLPYKYFEVRSRGDLMLRLNSNVTLRDIVSQNFITTVINLFLIIVIFTYIFIQSKMIALCLLLLGSLQIFVFVYSRSKFKRLTQAQIAAQSIAGSFMTEVLEGISTIKSLSIEEDVQKKWKSLFQQQLIAIRKKLYFQSKVNAFNNAFQFLTPLIVLFIGIYQIIEGNITIGMLFSFQALSMSFLGPLNSLAQMLSNFVMADTLLDRIYDVMNTKKEESPVEGTTQSVTDISKNLNGNITLENVSFKYSDYSEHALKNISMDVKAGQRVALVGKTGSGKSTLAKLLVGLYTPTTGNIYFDGYDIRQIDKKRIRQKIGIVLQDHFVFNRTVFDNITIHSPDSSLEDVVWAAQMAEIHQDIAKMPMNYQTLISEAGSNLSGGQKQRLALARSLVNKPEILLLDEATSALDTETEAKIAYNLRHLNCTQIVIAHRLSTIMKSDVIFVLDEGTIVDAGTHHELIQRCHHYANLVSSQIPENDSQQMYTEHH